MNRNRSRLKENSYRRNNKEKDYGCSSGCWKLCGDVRGV